MGGPCFVWQSWHPPARGAPPPSAAPAETRARPLPGRTTTPPSTRAPQTSARRRAHRARCRVTRRGSGSIRSTRSSVARSPSSSTGRARASPPTRERCARAPTRRTLFALAAGRPRASCIPHRVAQVPVGAQLHRLRVPRESVPLPLVHRVPTQPRHRRWRHHAPPPGAGSTPRHTRGFAASPSPQLSRAVFPRRCSSTGA